MNWLHALIPVAPLLGAVLLSPGAAAPADPAPAAKAEAGPGYVKDVKPILEQYCINCHGGQKPKAGFALDTIKTDRDADAARKSWDTVVRVLNAHEMPPEGKPKPTPAQRDTLLRFLDRQLAAVDCTKTRDPGRVTIRRLNRTEYNNTVRDLLGVDFKPADDFPPDDVGYGFDNIGDVLSMSPLLLEKYLAAAERVTRLAIVTTPAAPTTARYFGRRLIPEPRLTEPARDAFWKMTEKGELSFTTRLVADGEYVIRVRAYAQPAGSDPVKLSLRMDDKELQTFEVKATERFPRTYDHKFRAAAGPRKFSAAFVNPGKDGDKERVLFVQGMELQSPGVASLPESHRRLMVYHPAPGMTADEAARRNLEIFARKAYRRPVAKDEVERLVKLVKLAQAEGDSFEKGMALAVQAVLISPHFLFKIERDKDPNNPDAIHPVTEYELATRLSYFLWSSTPDEELYTLAGKNELRKNLDAQVKRMLLDPKSQALVENFGGQWLQTRNLKAMAPDAKTFPSFDEGLREAMIKEVDLFFGAVVKEDRSVLDFIDADFTYVNRRLAEHYGLPAFRIRGWERVSLKDNAEGRGGVLTMAAVLTLTSNPTRTSPVKRGKFILENILNSPPPPPPPDVPELSEDPKVTESAPLRVRLEQHRKDPGCASCHAKMDPLGIGFENFDGVGAYRRRDGKFDVDPSGVLPGGEKFKGPTELKTIFKKRSKDFVRCLSEKMLTYALGRGVEYFDKCAIDDIVKAVEKDDHRFSSLVLAVVKSEPFQMRRGKKGETK